MSGALIPAELALHARLGIPADLLTRAGVRHVSNADARELLSGRHPDDLAGLLYPYRDLATGEPQSYRLRRGHPEVENGEPLDKYLSAYGDAKHFFFPLETAELLADTSALAVIVEAEKSALAIMAAANRTGRHVLVIGTGGCWGWRGTCRQDDGRRRRTRR